MKVEVFKLYSDNDKTFDSINPSYIKWLFDSKNTRDIPPVHLNDELERPQSEDTIYFDGKISEYDLKSTLKNVVLKYDKPTLMSDKSKYTNFYEQENSNDVIFPMEFYVYDQLGLDTDIIEIGLNYDESTNAGEILYKLKRNFTEDLPIGTVEEVNVGKYTKLDEEEFKVENFSIEKEQLTKTLHRINFDIVLSNTDNGALFEVDNDIELGKYTEYKELEKLYIKVWDLAGNELIIFGEKPLIPITSTQMSFVEKLQKLIISFYGTYPKNLFLENDVIGNTTILVENQNGLLCYKYGMDIVLRLENDSLGYLVENTKRYDTTDGFIQNIEELNLTQYVDGIDAVGFVKANAWLYSSIFNNELNGFIKSHTFERGLLGSFIKECIDNTRKINVEPFLPDFTRGSVFFDFCKFLETFLNTEYTPLEKNCRVGLLEKIKRIGDFNDIHNIEFPAIKYYAEDRGSELQFDLEAFEKIRDMSTKYNDFDFDTKNMIRDLYKKLPFINKYKGTIDCFNILFRTLGLNVELIPMWAKKENEDSDVIFVPEYDTVFGNEDPNYTNTEYDDSYWLSSHILLKVNGYLAYDLVKIANAIYKLARSVLPVVRVIHHLLIEERSISANYLKLGFIDLQRDNSSSKENDIQGISFSWKTDRIKLVYKGGDVILEIPAYVDLCETSTDWDDWDEDYPNPKVGNCIGFFNSFKCMLNNYDRKLVIDFSKLSSGLTVADSLGDLVPKTFGGIKTKKITFETNKIKIHCDPSSIGVLSSIKTTDYLSITFVFRRITNKFCYTAKLQDVIPYKKTSNSLLPSWDFGINKT